jgi:hypothetical protein
MVEREGADTIPGGVGVKVARREEEGRRGEEEKSP